MLLARLQGPAAPPPGAQTCVSCHRAIVERYRRTAHFTTSMEANGRSIMGSFAPGHNLLETGVPGVSFRMEKRNGSFFQTGFDRNRLASTTARIDLVVGSGRRGQSYVYWKAGMLFELPVSYLTGAHSWINSPGYADGTIDFGRVIQPRCLECHATRFDLTGPPQAPRYAAGYEIGIGCQTCHGDGRSHVASQRARPTGKPLHDILNPARFTRERKVDNCALCHSGPRRLRRPAFSYQPGEPLDDYLGPRAGPAPGPPDVHGDQVGLLERSKCFRVSALMTCSTCHDVHQTQRDPAALSKKCLGCHEPTHHRPIAGMDRRQATVCVDCHMPTEKSGALQFNSPTQRFIPSFRNHTIAIYPAATAAVLARVRAR